MDEKRAEGGVTRAASVEAEDELVEIALKMLVAQAVIDAERPGLQIREDAVGPRQHDMSGHGADDMRIVIDAGRAGIGGPTVSLDRRALRHIGGDETMQRRGGEVLDLSETNAPRAVSRSQPRRRGAFCPGESARRRP